MFSSNPERVPCFPVVMSNPPGIENRLRPDGKKEPFCRDCFNAVNELRKAHNMEPLEHLHDAWEPSETL